MIKFDRNCFLKILSLSAFLISCDDQKATGPVKSGPTITPPVQLTTTGGTNPCASPDGQWVAFNGNGILAKIKTNGSELDTILNSGGINPDWSDWLRNGNLIVTGSFVVTVDATSGAVTPVSGGDDCLENNPVWSPSGNEIATPSRCPDRIMLIGYPSGDTSSVPCMDPDGTDCEGEGATWSGDGNWLAFEDGLQILKVPKTGGTAEVVHDGFNPAGSKDVTEPAWSPDGKWIAFVREDTCFTDSMLDFVCYLHIWVADSRGDSLDLWQVTTGPFADRDPAWSPNSNFIYFSSNRSGVNEREIWKLGFSFQTDDGVSRPQEM